MNRVANMLDADSLAQNQAIIKIREISWLLRVDAEQIKIVPNSLEKIVQVQLHVAANDDGVRLMSKAVNFLDGNLVDFVVHVNARQINSIADDHVDELLSGAVLAEKHFGVENLEGMQNRLHHFLVALRQRTRAVEGQAAALFHLIIDVGLLLI